VTEALLTLNFSAEGNARHYVGAGWSSAEKGARWMVGQVSEIWLEHPGAGDLVLELDVDPFIAAPVPRYQRLAVAARGVQVGECTLSSGGRVGFFIPSVLVEEKGPIRLTLVHPDQMRPSEATGSADDRQLAVAVSTARLLRPRRIAPAGPGKEGKSAAASHVVDLPLEALALRFESLGDNCEFGLVQRRCGAEPLGLLRFANINLATLIRGIRSGFAGLGEPGTVLLVDDPADDEYVVRETMYDMTQHTFIYKADESPDGLLARQCNRLRFLRRKLMEDIRNGEKIFVYKRNLPLQEAEVLPLLMTLYDYGTNTLLWISPADEAHPAGSVERRVPGLLHGFIDRFAPSENAHDLSFDVWITLCRNAAALEGS